MTDHVVCSFYVDRFDQFPSPPDYLSMLAILDRSCKRAGFSHVVLTDHATGLRIHDAGMATFATDLPNSLMRATTEAHARWLESPLSNGLHTIYMGADCLVRRDFRDELPICDLAIAYMKGHKRWRINNGFVYIPAGRRRAQVASVLRGIADNTSETMFDDMLAFERALVPMPPDFGCHERRGLAVEFLPLPKWNRYMAVCKETPKPLDDAAEDANVLHFMGGHDKGKALYFEWAKRHGFAA